MFTLSKLEWCVVTGGEKSSVVLQYILTMLGCLEMVQECDGQADGITIAHNHAVKM